MTYLTDQLNWQMEDTYGLWPAGRRASAALAAFSLEDAERFER